jgi:hypothetical protein
MNADSPIELLPSLRDTAACSVPTMSRPTILASREYSRLSFSTSDA